jgi:hypothetical protein
MPSQAFGQDAWTATSVPPGLRLGLYKIEQIWGVLMSVPLCEIAGKRNSPPSPNNPDDHRGLLAGSWTMAASGVKKRRDLQAGGVIKTAIIPVYPHFSLFK